MKTYLGKYFTVGLLVVLFTSCNDDAFLVEKPMTFLVPENTFTSPSGVRQGISGLHAAVRNGWYFGEELQEPGSIYKGLGTDVAFFGDNPGATIFLCNYETYLTPTTGVVETYWDRSYQIIQRANVLIQAIDDMPEEQWDSSEQKEAYKAEAMFFRAWAYRLLTSFYGACPVIDYVISTPKTDFERDPVEQAYLLMESDLIFGTGSLPDPGKEEEKGRITKGAAWQLLCEVYLAQHKYQDAVTAATNVLTRFNYQLMTERFGSTVDVFGSGDVYLDLFAFGNQNIAENTEAIWVLQFEPLTTDSYANARGCRAFGPAYFRVNFTPDGFKAIRGELYNGTYTGYSDTLGRGVAWLRPTTHVTHEIWYSDWDNDIRNASPHNIKRDFYYDAPGSAYDKQKIDFSLYPPETRNAIIDTCQYIYPFFMKVHDPCHVLTNIDRSGNGDTFKDLYAMRLGETYLLRAEAYLGLNQPELAAADINAVRQRAHAKPVAIADVNLDYLLDERIRELYAEECRHIVLNRTGTLLERTRKYNNNPIFPGENIQDYNVLWPIPQKEIDLNISRKWENNPGYR